MLGYLMYRSGLVPRRMAMFGLIGGPLLILSFVLILFGAYENGSGPSSLLALPEIAWELSLGVFTRRGKASDQARSPIPTFAIPSPVIRSTPCQAAQPRATGLIIAGGCTPFASTGTALIRGNITQDLLDMGATSCPSRSLAHLARHLSTHTPRVLNNPGDAIRSGELHEHLLDIGQRVAFCRGPVGIRHAPCEAGGDE